MLFTANSPLEHRFIREKEREYIISRTKETAANARKVVKYWKLIYLCSQIQKNFIINLLQPLYIVGKIFRSKPFWAAVIAHTFANFGTYLFLTQLPTYMKEVLKFDIQSNGI